MKKKPGGGGRPSSRKRRASRAGTGPSATAPLKGYREKRDFQKTAEPAGRAKRRRAASGRRRAPKGPPRRSFVVQKHAARRTHFDLRLEMSGVLRSWAVPKGPSLDPKEKRLAVAVEEHPLEYGEFEGRIPKGEYGAGPVIIWDRGYYVPIYPSAEATDEELEEGYRQGKVEFELFGARLRGRWGLIRIRGSAPGDAGGKAPWLLIKKKDRHASSDRDLVAEYETSVVSGLTLSEMEEARGAGKRAGEGKGPGSGRAAGAGTGAGAVAAAAPDFQPMLAERSDRLPAGHGWCFEEKIDGIRVVARAAPGDVRLLSRTGQRLGTAFPEVAAALQELADRSGATFVLDGELAVRGPDGRTRFADIQPRINLKAASEIAAWARKAPAEFFAFDCLWANGLRFADRPLRERKAALRELLRLAGEGIREVPSWEGEGEGAWERARAEGWEGLLAKRWASRYQPGCRSRDWLKVKAVNQDEFVVVGWTDPEGSRAGFGALLLGAYDEAGRLRYVGRVGTGFDAKALKSIGRELRALEREASPCVDPPEESARHWARPRLVAMVKYQERTRDGRLREPVFLGLRGDKPAEEVRLAGRADGAGGPRDAGLGPPLSSELEALLADLERLESGRKGLRTVVDGVDLKLTNLSKELWPGEGITKGDLLRYYARISPWLLPALAGRPLHMERYPNGIGGEAFWQQRAPSPLPKGLRAVEVEHGGEEAPRLVGGSLATLLYTAQLAAITQHAWASRVGSLEFADYTILDLDPGGEVAFDLVRDVARWVRDELERLEMVGCVKTSGGRGLHVILPLAPGTPHATARLFAQVVATLVVRRHPSRTTIERSLKRRPKEKVYLDCFQNDHGKTIASVYSVRARPGAPVSVPLRWEELDADVDPQDFRLRNVWERFPSVGDLWEPTRRAGNVVEEVIDRLEASTGPPKKRAGSTSEASST